MGACLSCKTSRKIGVKTIRVVHLDGFLEVYEDPTTVDQVIVNFPKHFVCTPIQLMQSGLVPLKLETQLESGKTYFVLPNSVLRHDESPRDLISLTQKLTNIAKTGRCHTKSNPTSPLNSPSRQAKPSSRVSNGGPNNEKKDTQKPCKALSWKPILATIREISFNRRSESDLQE